MFASDPVNMFRRRLVPPEIPFVSGRLPPKVLPERSIRQELPELPLHAAARAAGRPALLYKTIPTAVRPLEVLQFGQFGRCEEASAPVPVPVPATNDCQHALLSEIPEMPDVVMLDVDDEPSDVSMVDAEPTEVDAADAVSSLTFSASISLPHVGDSLTLWFYSAAPRPSRSGVFRAPISLPRSYIDYTSRHGYRVEARAAVPESGRVCSCSSRYLSSSSPSSPCWPTFCPGPASYGFGHSPRSRLDPGSRSCLCFDRSRRHSQGSTDKSDSAAAEVKHSGRLPLIDHLPGLAN